MTETSFSRRILVGCSIGAGAALVDNFWLKGEVSPIVIVLIMFSGSFALGLKWGARAWIALLAMWILVPGAHLFKYLFRYPDTLHPNSLRSIGLLAIFTLIISVLGVFLGALSNRLTAKYTKRD